MEYQKKLMWLKDHEELTGEEGNNPGEEFSGMNPLDIHRWDHQSVIETVMNTLIPRQHYLDLKKSLK
jgi:hypothetical protein